MPPPPPVVVTRCNKPSCKARVLAVLAAALFSFVLFTPQAKAAAPDPFDGADFSAAIDALIAANPNADMTAVTNALMANAQAGAGQALPIADFAVNLAVVAQQFGLSGITIDANGVINFPGGPSYTGPVASGSLVDTVVAAYIAIIGTAQGAAVGQIMTDENNKIIAAIQAAGGGAAGIAAYVKTLVYDGTYAATTGDAAAKDAAATAAANAAVESVVKTILATEQASGNRDSSGAQAAAASATLMLNSVQQFNTAIAQQFGDSAIHNVVLNSLAGGRASAGGATGSASDRGLVGFVKAYGGFGSQDNTARNGRKITGSDFGGVGVATGVGYKLSQELELGALIGYSWNHTESKTPNGGNFSLGEVTDNTLRLGLYGNFTWDNLFVTSSPTFGIHLLNGERAVSATEKAKNDRTGFDFSWFNRAGYTFALPAEFFITPSYALGMTYLHDPAYSEYGVPAAAAVKYHDYDNWSLLQTLDLRVGRLFRVNDCFAILPEIWGGWEHEYLDPNSVTTTMSAGGIDTTGQYRVQGIAQDRAVLGVGLTTIIQNKYEVFGRYDERLWDGGHLSQFSVGLSVKF